MNIEHSISRRVYNAMIGLQKNGDSFSVMQVLAAVNRDHGKTPATLRQIVRAVNDWKDKGVVVTSGAIGKFNWSE